MNAPLSTSPLPSDEEILERASRMHPASVKIGDHTWSPEEIVELWVRNQRAAVAMAIAGRNVYRAEIRSVKYFGVRIATPCPNCRVEGRVRSTASPGWYWCDACDTRVSLSELIEGK